MITIQHKWGADYLVFNEPVNPAPHAITSPQGVTLTPGQRISKIGCKKRTSFCLCVYQFWLSMLPHWTWRPFRHGGRCTG